MLFRGPKTYRSMEEFEREEIRPGQKMGFSLDDLFQEANLNAPEEHEPEGPAELDFDF